MDMKTIGIPPCTGTPGQPLQYMLSKAFKKQVLHELYNGLSWLSYLWYKGFIKDCHAFVGS